MTRPLMPVTARPPDRTDRPDRPDRTDRADRAEPMAGPAVGPTVEQGQGSRPLGGSGHELSVPVGSLIAGPPLFVRADATVAEAARSMRAARTSSALVEDGGLGIVTSGDLRNRVLAEELPADRPVRDVVTRPIRTLPDDAPLYAALLLMLDGGFEHVPIMRDGEVVGVVTHMDMIRHQARSPMLVLGRIRAIDRLDALTGYAAGVAETAAALVDDGVEPLRIARVIAGLNDALTQRLLGLAEERLGPPPCAYAWLALGSEGRREQVLLSDQDNAVAYAEPGPTPADYFARLADLVVSGLLAAGLPPCPGGYMATNWSRPLPEWVDTVNRWVRAPEPQAIVEAEVFLDFRPVHGELSVEPMSAALRRGTTSAVFLAQLARAATKFEPPMGPFGRIRSRDGYVDVKAGGIAAVVLTARLYGVAAGSPARSTLDRLEDAVGQGHLSAAAARVLSDAFGFLMGLRLRSQLSALATGATPDNRVCLDDLSWLEHRRLRDTMRTIQETQQATSLRFLNE